MINSDIIIRQIQLSIITDTPNQIIDWFKDLWNNLAVIQGNIFHKYQGEYIYYTKIDKRPVFYLDNTKGQVLYDYDIYSIYFYTQDDFDYISTSDLQKITILLLSIVLGYDNLLSSKEVHLGRMGEIKDILHGL